MKKLGSLVAGWAAVAVSSAWAQDVEVTRRGDGTVVVPGREGEVTVTTRTEANPISLRPPRKGLRIDEKIVEPFLRERMKLSDEWT